MVVENNLQDALESMRREEAVKKKKKPAFHVPQEKRLQYYSGWDKKDKKEDKVIGKVLYVLCALVIGYIGVWAVYEHDWITVILALILLGIFSLPALFGQSEDSDKDEDKKDWI